MTVGTRAAGVVGSVGSSTRSLSLTAILTAALWAVTSVGADARTNVPDTIGDPAVVERAFNDHRLAAWIMVLGSIYVAVAVVLFAAGAHRVLADSGVPGFATAALGGGVLLAMAMLVHQGITKFVLLAAANDHDTASLHTLGYLDAVTWLPLDAGAGVFLLAVGLGSRRSRMMPTWLAVTTVVLGVLALLGPGFLLFWLLAPVWFVFAGVTLERRSLTPGSTRQV
jgi:hypothetical protein